MFGFVVETVLTAHSKTFGWQIRKGRICVSDHLLQLACLPWAWEPVCDASTIFVTLSQRWPAILVAFRPTTLASLLEAARALCQVAGDGGVSGFQFDILSDGNNISAPVPLAATGPNFAKVKTTFAISSSDFATQLVPQKIDVGAAQGYPNDTDTDLDAYAGSFADSNSGFTNTTLGQASSGNGALIATEQWTIPDGQADHLSVFLTGPQYYDFSNTTPGSGFRTGFTQTVTTGASIGAAGTTPSRRR